MDGDSCDPDANTCILKTNDIYFGISAHTRCAGMPFCVYF